MLVISIFVFSHLFISWSFAIVEKSFEIISSFGYSFEVKPAPHSACFSSYFQAEKAYCSFPFHTILQATAILFFSSYLYFRFLTGFICYEILLFFIKAVLYYHPLACFNIFPLTIHFVAIEPIEGKFQFAMCHFEAAFMLNYYFLFFEISDSITIYFTFHVYLIIILYYLFIEISTFMFMHYLFLNFSIEFAYMPLALLEL